MLVQTMRRFSRNVRSGMGLAAALIAATLALGVLKDVLIYSPNGADADLDSGSIVVTEKIN